MKKEKIKNTLRKIFKKVFSIKNTKNNIAYTNCPTWDSTKHFELICEIEKIFKIHIELKETMKFNSFNYIENYLNKNIKK